MAVRIFWAIICGFVVGVSVQSIVPVGVVTLGWLVALAGLILLTHPFARVPLSVVMIAAFALVACAAGAMRMQSATVASDPTIDAFVGERVAIEGVIVAEPDVREKNVRLTVRIGAVGSTTVASKLSVIVSAPLHSPGSYGDYVRAEGTLRAPERFETGEGRYFDYPGFLAKDRVLYQMSFARVDVIEEGKGNRFRAGALWLKQRFLEGLAPALPEPYAGLAGGITVGDKRGLGEELSETFRVAGLTHIVVLSGYNIIVVVEAVLRALSRVPSVVRLSIGAFIALFFAAITGFASASTRAALMATIAIVGKATGRTYIATRALAVVAFGMVVWNPYVVFYDPGFQLSVTATLGLITLSPPVVPYLMWVTERYGLREIVAGTFATQIAVLPLLLYQTGAFSIVALPANFLVLATLPLAMFFSAIAAFCGLFTGILAPFFGFPALVFLSYITTTATLLSSIPLATIHIPDFGGGMLALCYATLLLLVWSQKEEAEPEGSAVKGVCT